MKKRGAKRTVSYGLKPKAPILVMRTIEQVPLETREWRAVNVFAFGTAETDDFYTLQDMLNLLLIAGQSAPQRRYAMLYAEKHFKPVLVSIQQRWERTGKWGVAGGELEMLKQMVAYSRTFWVRQSTELLMVCAAEAKAFYRECEQKRVAA